MAQVSPQQSRSVVDAAPIKFELVGHGPRHVLVLQGWFGDQTVWATACPFIDQSRFAFALLDNRGYGLSRGRPGEHSIRELAADAIALADQLGWERFSVVGHSMGGQAAQRVAIDAPDRVEAIIGITPVPSTGMPDVPRALFDAVCEDDVAGLQVLNMSLGNRLKPEFAESLMRLTRATAETAAMRDYGRAFIETDFGDEARAIRAPFLVLVGEHDGGLTEAFARKVFPAIYPHVQVEAVPNAGHYPMIETPAWLMTRIEQFLVEQTRASEMT